MEKSLPVGKLPPELFRRLLERFTVHDPRVILGPGMGLDCAVIDAGPTLLVLKSDPISFATEEIGWYLVQVNANDIATTGAVPRWMLVTLLLPEGSSPPALVEDITSQIALASKALGISVVGGHTEVTHGLQQPVAVGMLIGEVERERLITPRGASPGDRVLLTKGVPIEATSLLAREFPERLKPVLTEAEIRQAAEFLFTPGISVLRDAQIAMRAGKVTAMHDPTEGGLASALWELAEASGRSLVIDLAAVPVPDLAQKVCAVFQIDPLAAIASGALLLTVPPQDAAHICEALRSEGIECADVGSVEDGAPGVWKTAPSPREMLPRPPRDEIARVFDAAR